MIRLMLIAFLFLSCKEQETSTTPGEKPDLIADSEQEEKHASENWSGTWEYVNNPDNADVPRDMFTLTIETEGTAVKAQYCAIARSGGKIDCENGTEYNVTGTIENGKMAAAFYSFFGTTKDKGLAEITYIDENSIRWKIIKKPGSEYYCPQECMLIRKNKEMPEKANVVTDPDRYTLDSAVWDVNGDNYPDKLLVMEPRQFRNKPNHQHYGLIFQLLKGTKNRAFVFWKRNDGLLSSLDNNCPADGYQRIATKGNYFTIEQTTCADFKFIHQYITFKYDRQKDDILFYRYGEAYTDRSDPDRDIPAVNYNIGRFGSLTFEEVSDAALIKIRQNKP